METFKDFFSELKQRASSPLFASFTISWLIINWPITLGLLFYTQEQLRLDGIKSYYDLVQHYSSSLYNFWIPLLLAIIYTIFFPFVKAGIKLLYSWVSNINETAIIKVTKDGYMPVKKYIELREVHQSLVSQLSTLISSQSTTHDENVQLKKDLVDEKLKVDEHKNEILAQTEVINYLKASNTPYVLRGKWRFEVHSIDKPVNEEWEVSQLEIKVGKVVKYTIVHCLASKDSKILALSYKMKQHQPVSYWFKCNNSFTVLTSTDGTITLTKIGEL